MSDQGIKLDELPLTHAGKVNRKALPLPSREEKGAGAQYRMPRTPIEKKLAWIWGEILGIRRAGTDYNFFESGGHSVKTTQLVSKIQNEMNLKLALRDLFHAPTIAGLVGIVQHQSSNAGAVKQNKGQS
ncbi:MAG: hypothetical protein HQM14_05370 [SAR324 cluster bacterium]|nr:hypothetical protein [SAR324 cluster bacterium]